MLKIDAHQHFWKYNPWRESWITDEMAAIQRDFLPGDLQPLLHQHGFDGCVLVQSAQPEEENDFLLEQAQKYDFVKGVVGWVDLLAEDVEEKLAHYKQFEKLKGFRYILQGNPDPAIMLRPEFMRGVGKLAKYGYTYDVLIYPNQLDFSREFVAAFPDQPFVIDHLAKPDIRNQSIVDWRQSMKAFGKYENVSCKVSGMVTEADWQHWEKEDFRPYLDTIVETFGTSRLMFGSDWPVCLVAARYGEMLGIVEDYFSEFSKEEQAAIFGGNATKFYNLT
ncbi:amidohydrolase family protein [Pontibacter chinhatensis]|uniref:L-fuconolactonase n=1 Tax=Pontibacter chinhatensis TaxID=1436961 RepID=A0A1I2RDZ2_9BACT|nr:amidohydrolase family protein [Pontibacter chinhatensis]SFG38243.1 L-fuconolactonase [Pontibacter chinhatensis]